MENPLRVYLTAHSITVAKAALELECSHQHLYGILNGKHRPGFGFAQQVERWTGSAVPWAILMAWEPPEPENGDAARDTDAGAAL